MAHVTGGGLASNLARVLPDAVSAVVDRSTWSPQPIFGLVGDVGAVAQSDLEATLNMGVGMVAVTPATRPTRRSALLGEAGIAAWVCGEVGDRPGGTVELDRLLRRLTCRPNDRRPSARSRVQRHHRTRPVPVCVGCLVRVSLCPREDQMTARARHGGPG